MNVRLPAAHAARIVATKSTATRRNSSACALRLSADDMTWSAVAPVSATAWLSPAVLAETSAVPRAASCTLCAISTVAAPCSWTAAAIVVAIWLIDWMTSAMAPIERTASPVEPWMSLMNV